MERLAVRRPVPEGLKVTEIVQEPSTGTLTPQVFDAVKSFGSEPVSEIDVIVSNVLPVLVSVMVCGALVLPTVLAPKLSLLGTSFTVPLESVIAELADFVASVAELPTMLTGEFAGGRAAGAV
jgi:hypothetical protein